MRISCAQTDPVYKDIERNLETMAATVAASSADLIIFPELALSGYAFMTAAEAKPCSAPINGELSQKIGAIAQRNNRAIVTGFLEESEGLLYNSSLAFDSRGKLIGHYRKVHLFYYENEVFQSGNLGFPVFELSTNSGKIQTGMMICYDWRFPEAARSLTLAGAELIAVPSNIVTTTGMLHTTLQTRAFENKVVIAFADRFGYEMLGEETLQYRGESAIINYNGSVICQATSDRTQIIDAEIDFGPTRAKVINRFNDILGDRRPKQYRQ